MRIAADILMIIYGVKAIGSFPVFLSEVGFHVFYGDGNTLALNLSVIITVVFIITGGGFLPKEDILENILRFKPLPFAIYGL